MSIRVLTNAGSNIPPELLKRWRIIVPTQKFEVNGVLHDFATATTAMVDGWLASGAVPQVAGTTATEFAAIFRETTANGDALIVITSSRKLTTTHDNAVRALTAFKAEKPHAQIAVIDTGVSDTASGLLVIMAARAIEEGKSFEQVKHIVSAHCRDVTLAAVPGSVDYLVRSGRASSLRGFMANLLKVAPIVTVRDGTLVADGTVSRAKQVKSLVDYAVTRTGTSRPVWAAVAWANDKGPVAELEKELRAHFDIRYFYKNQLSITAYLFLGTKTFSVAVIPISPEVAAFDRRP